MTEETDRYRLTTVVVDSWSQVVASAPEQAAWYLADLGGARVESALSPQRPVCSHVWGWSTSRWTRIRLDGNRFHVGHLDVDPDASHGAAEEVEVRVIRSNTWALSDTRVGLAGPGRDLLTGRAAVTRSVSRGSGTLLFHEILPRGAGRA